MNRVAWILSLLIVFVLSKTAYADTPVCMTQPNSPFSGLASISKQSCQDTLKSKECQDLFSKMRAAGEKPEDKALKCYDRSALAEAFENDFDFRMGCAIGGWNFIKDTFVSIGTAIGEGAAKIVIDAKNAKAENDACDADFNIKKGMFKIYNDSDPTLLQTTVPPDEMIKSLKCANIKSTLKLIQLNKEQEANSKLIRKVTLSKNAPLTPQEQELKAWNESKIPKSNVDLIAMAKEKIKDIGVKLECYNTQERAAMICEAVAEVASLAAGPAGAALKAAKVKNILEIAGVAADAEKAGVAAAAGGRFVASAADLEKAAALSNADRIAAAQSALGRPLTTAEKQALIDAHNVAADTGRGYGTYSATDLKQKADILKTAGFSDTERSTLMRQGLAGSLSDTQKAKTTYNTLRLQAEKISASGDVKQADSIYKSSADSYEVVMKDPKYPKSSRDYAVGASSNRSAGRFDKAADYYLKSYGQMRDNDKVDAVFEALRREKDELRVIAFQNPGNAAAQQNYENQRKLIEAVLNNPQFRTSDAIKRELLKP